MGDEAPGTGARLQDPYGLRCAPQLNGAAQDSLDRMIEIVELDMNAAMENPLIAEVGNGPPAGDGWDRRGPLERELSHQ